MRSDPEQHLSFLEAELRAYRAENDRLARELVLTRRTFEALHLNSSASPAGKISTPLLLPRTSCAGDDVFFHIDHFGITGQIVRIDGWAFCPRIDGDKARPAILLESSQAVFLIRPHSVQRPDVVAFHEQTDFGPHHIDRSKLVHSGFSVLLERPPLFDVKCAYKLLIQIDGPDFSVCKSTGVNLHD